MKNFKINNNQPPLTGADLISGQSFGKLLKAYHGAKLPFFKAAKFWIGSAATTVAVVTSVVVYTHVMGKADSHSFVNPPLPAADISTTTYILEAQIDSTITY